MMSATEDPAEYKMCIEAFCKYGRKFGWSMLKRRKKVLAPGEGRFFNCSVNESWMGWQTAWDYLRS